MLSTRAGRKPPSSEWRSASSSRSAASIASGVVPCSLQTASLTAGIGLDGAPVMVAQQQVVRFAWSLRPGFVLRQRTSSVLPGAQDRVADAPLRLDLVVAREQRRV